MEIWDLLGAGVVGLWVGGMLVLSRLPETSLSRQLRAFASCAALWAVGDLVAANAPDYFWKQVGVAGLYSGAIFIPPIWWLMALRRAQSLGGVSGFDGRRWTAGPLAFAALMWVGMITNPWHGQFIVPVLGGQNLYGPLWWAMSLPSYAMICGVFALELHVIVRVRDTRVRRQAGFMILASSLMLAGNLLYVSGVVDGLNGTLPVMAASGAVLVAGMLRGGLFGVLPMALPVIASHDPDGLLVLQPNGRLIHANPRARAILAPVVLAEHLPCLETLAGWLHDAEGRAVSEAGPDWQQRWWRSVLQEGGALYRFGRAGERRLRVTAQLVYGRRQRLVAQCLRIHDATEEQRTESALRRAQRLEVVEEVARGVAHDFKNLLVVVQGNAELLADRVPGTPDLQRKLHRILSATEQARELARQLQVYSGAAEPRRADLDLGAVVGDALEAFDPAQAPDRGARRPSVHLVQRLEEARAQADATQIRQLALNLVENARDAVDEPGEICVETGTVSLDPGAAPNLALGEAQPAGAYAYVRVSDAGAGMTPELQERIFEPFFTTKGKHSGIGLATVFGIARSHGAVLQLESQEGRGTTFTVYFPQEPGGQPPRPVKLFAKSPW